MLDWELCTLGDPLADLGYLGVHWTDPGASARRQNDPTGAGGFGSFADALERYAAGSRLDLSGIDYYLAFQSWRLAVIIEGVYDRYLHGAMGDSALVGAELEAFVTATAAVLEARRRWPGRADACTVALEHTPVGYVAWNAPPGYDETRTRSASGCAAWRGRSAGSSAWSRRTPTASTC